ncbi:hypothetical protein OS42_46130 [Dickeya oryzae]
MDFKLLKNILSLISIQGANFLIPLITLPYLVRVLEPSGYGYLSFAIAVTQYFVLVTEYGFNLSITQKIALVRDDLVRVSEIFWTVLFCKFFSFFL